MNIKEELDQEIDQQHPVLRAIYDAAVKAGDYKGSWEEWLEAVL